MSACPKVNLKSGVQDMFMRIVSVLFLHSHCSFLNVKNSPLDLYFWPYCKAAAVGPNSCAARGSRPRPCMFSIDSGIYMSPELQAHEWAPVCWFCFDVTSSVRIGALVKTGTHHGPHAFQRDPRRPLKKPKCGDLNNTQICWTDLCHYEFVTIAASTVHWIHPLIHL